MFTCKKQANKINRYFLTSSWFDGMLRRLPFKRRQIQISRVWSIILVIMSWTQTFLTCQSQVRPIFCANTSCHSKFFQILLLKSVAHRARVTNCTSVYKFTRYSRQYTHTPCGSPYSWIWRCYLPHWTVAVAVCPACVSGSTIMSEE